MKSEYKVLLVYPGLFMQTALPLSIASLAASLRTAGIEVRVFDTVLYQEPGEIDENEQRAVHLQTGHLDYEAVGLKKKETDVVDDFQSVVREYQPSLIGVSCVESTFGRALKLVRGAKAVSNAPIIFGGIFPTFAPQIVIDEPSIDMLCIGEGEGPLLDLCRTLMAGEDPSGIRNLWVKKDGVVVKNEVRPLRSLDDGLDADFSVFGKHLFYKAMQGKLLRTIPIELSRGCPYQCSYCAAPSLRKMYRSHNQSYLRHKPMDRLFSEMRKLVAQYSPEFLYFSSETFLAMSNEEFDDFIDGYKSIELPFWVQTRPETITKARILRLQEVGMYWITVGVECGNEEFRRKHLKRFMTNEVIEKAIGILAECNQGASLNSIIGFPHETRELILDTIMFHRKLHAINPLTKFNIALFTPFRGCELYEESVRSGFFTPVPYLDTTTMSRSALVLDSITPEELAGIYRTINLYVYLPLEDFDQIRLAETFSEDGNRLYENLNKKTNGFLAP